MNERRSRMLEVVRGLAAEFLQREANPEPLITVTKADISPDFLRATIYITTYPESEEENALNFLKRKGSEFRDYAKKHGRFRTIPHFDFSIDSGERNRQRIDEISNK